jgi:hypothetical protein
VIALVGYLLYDTIISNLALSMHYE